MATLTSTKIKNTYDALLKASDNDAIGSSAKQITDGLGNGTPLYISTTQIGIGVTPEATYDLHVYSNAKVGGNLTITGDLTVNGTTTTVDTDTLRVEDPLIEVARNNTSADSVDIGIYGKYAPSATTLYSGLFRDAGDDKFKLFKNLEEEPTTTVNTSGTGYTKAGLVIGGLEATTGDFTDTVTVDGDIEVENSSGFGRIEIGGSSGGYIDLKSPFSDDFDLRLYTAGTNAQINALNGELDITANTNINLQYQGTDVLVMSSTGVAVTGTGSFTGQVTIPETPVADTDAASKGYVDGLVEGQDTLAEILANGNTTGGTDLIVSTSDQIFLPNGSLSNPALSFTDDTDTGISYDLALKLVFAGAEAVKITSANVDIKPNGTSVLRVDTTGVNFFQDAIFGNDIKAKFGGSGDLQIYHSATGDSYIVNNTGNLIINSSGITGTAIKDEDNMASNSASHLATQQSIKAYVDSQVGANNELSEVLANGNTTGGTDIAITAGDKITNFTSTGIDDNATSTALTIDSSENTNFAGDISIPVSNKLLFGGGNHTYISEDVDDNLTFFVGGAEFMRFTEGVSDTINFYQDVTFSGDLIVPEYIKHEGDTDTSIRFTTNTIRFYTANNEVLELESDGQVNVISSGTATNPCITIGDDVNTGIWRPALDTFAISTGGSERIRIDSSGRVGIGTTSPAYKFHVSNNINGFIGRFTGGVSSDVNIGIFGNSTNNFGSIGTESNDRFSFFTNGVDRLNISNTGSVGIGVTSPNAGLQIALGGTSIPSAGSNTGSVCFGNTTSGSAYGLVMGANSSGVGYISSQRTDGGATTYNLAIQPNGGNVGINETNPSSSISSSSTVLQISDSNVASLALNQSSVGKYEIAASGLGLDIRRNGTNHLIIDSSGDVAIKASGADQVRTLSIEGTNGSSELYQFNLVADGENAVAKFMIGVGGGTATERMRIDSSGATSFAGSASVSTAVASIQHLSSNGYLYIKGGSGGLIIGDDSTSSRIQIEDNSNIRFETAGTERMRIDSSGNVLIGGTSSTGGAGSGAGRGNLFLAGSTSNKIIFNNNSSTVNGYLYSDSSELQISSGSGYTNFHTGGSERMRITSGGTIEIRNGGTNGGEIKLTGADNDLTINGARGQIILQINGTNAYEVDSVQLYPSADNSKNLGTSSLRWSTVYAANGINTSDETLKENIEECDLGIDFIDSLKPKSYNFKDLKEDNDAYGKKRYGLIAQDILQTELKDSVFGKKDGEYGLSYNDLIAPMIKAIQELKADNDSLRARIETLENN